MKCWPTAWALCFAITGCDGMATFRGQSRAQSVGPQDMLPPEGSDATPRTNDALLNCLAETSATPSRPQTLTLPSRCPRSFTAPNGPNRTLDVVFALDVTGSMRSELATVRAGIEALSQRVEREGWTLRAGAVAFADELLEVHPPEGDLAALWHAMSPESSVWAAPDGFGGDAPEVGFAAIERSLELLTESDPEGTTGEKLIVYVSDAPAQRTARGSFDVSTTAEKLKAFAVRTQSNGRSSFRFFTSASPSRSGLMDEFPTPSKQMESLAKAAGVLASPLPFPLNASGFETHFLQKVGEESIQTEICALEKVVVSDKKGEVRLLDTKAAREQTWWKSRIPTSMEKGIYDVEIHRACTHAGPEVVKAKWEIK